jgi:hypothetical protein
MQDLFVQMESQDPNSLSSDERWLLYLMKGKIMGKMKNPVEDSLVSLGTFAGSGNAEE